MLSNVCLELVFQPYEEVDINLSDLPKVIYACFVLHNFCEVNKEPISDKRVRTVMEDYRASQSSSQHTLLIQSNETEGKCVRRVLTKYFDRHAINQLL